MDPRTVATLGQAMLKADEYDRPISFLIAPLKTKTGQRSWMGPNPDKSAWVPHNDERCVPSPLDEGADDLPPLPPSPISLYCFCFVNEEGRPLRPYITIDPSLSPDGRADTIPTPGDGAGSSDVPLMPYMLSLVKQKDSHVLAMLSELQKAQASITTQQIALVAEWKKVSDQHADDLREAIKTRDMAIAANAGLSQQLAEAREGSEMWQTIRVLFDGKPEVLLRALSDLAGGVLKAVKETKA